MKLSTRMREGMGVVDGGPLERKIWAYHWNFGVCPRCGGTRPRVEAYDSNREVTHYKCLVCCESGSSLGKDEQPPTLAEVLVYETKHTI